jgi:hypothetical protein
MGIVRVAGGRGVVECDTYPSCHAAVDGGSAGCPVA